MKSYDMVILRTGNAFSILLDAGVSSPDDEVSFGRAQDRLFVSAKVTKTMDAPSGLTEEEGRELFAERPNSPGSHKGR